MDESPKTGRGEAGPPGPCEHKNKLNPAFHPQGCHGGRAFPRTRWEEGGWTQAMRAELRGHQWQEPSMLPRWQRWLLALAAGLARGWGGLGALLTPYGAILISHFPGKRRLLKKTIISS